MTSDSFAANRDNFCYRHPKNQSFVLCQRCGRTVCPECQTQAPVGVVCPDCMAAQRKAEPRNVRVARRRSAVAMAAANTQPVVTYWLIGITATMFVVNLIPGLNVGEWLAFYAPYLYPDVSGHFEPWRLFTVMLVHAGWWHLGLNMLSLWLIGRMLEPLVGHFRFLALYVISGLGGSVAAALLAFDTPVVGASGAIFGLLGALLVIGRALGAELTGIIVIVGINLVLGFLPGAQVSWQSHVGGLVTGAVIGLIYARTRMRRQRGAQIGWMIALVVVLCGLVAIPAITYAT